MMGPIGKIMEGNSYLAQGRYNSAIAERNAQSIERGGAADEARVREDVRGTMGQQLVAQGSSGFQLGTGSHADALMQSQVNGMLDALTIRRKAQGDATSVRVGGQQQRFEARNRATASYFGAAQSAAETAMKFMGT